MNKVNEKPVREKEEWCFINKMMLVLTIIPMVYIVISLICHYLI